jgi:hypothetical protein
VKGLLAGGFAFWLGFLVASLMVLDEAPPRGLANAAGTVLVLIGFLAVGYFVGLKSHDQQSEGER